MNALAEAAPLRAATTDSHHDSHDASVNHSANGGDNYGANHGDSAHARVLARLCAAVDAALTACTIPGDPSRCPGFARDVRAALAHAIAEPALIEAAHREGGAQSYRRHLLAACPCGRYAVAALVWQPGHASPVHAHHTWCGYAVHEGTLSETLYAWDSAHEGARAVRTQPRASGDVAFGGRGRANIHRLSNDSGQPAISLHVYGVAADGIATRVNDILPLARSLATV